MKKSLDKGDFAEDKIAQSMIEGDMKSKDGKCKQKIVDLEEKIEE